MIRCPHCQEAGCDGRCRFRLGRRGFIGLALGALASVLVAPRLPDLGNYTEIIRTPFGFTTIDSIAPLYAGERVVVDMGNEIVMYRATASPFIALSERCKENRAAVAAYDWFNKPLYRRS